MIVNLEQRNYTKVTSEVIQIFWNNIQVSQLIKYMFTLLNLS